MGHPPSTVPPVIDLSHNNPGLDTADDFAALYAAGVRLVIHKATQGVSFADPMYAVRRPLALTAGLKWDAYHFCTSDPETAQLAYFLSVTDLDDTMRGALDAEQNAGATISPISAGVLAAGLDSKLGRQVLRYGNASVLEYKQPLWHDGPIWWAKYGDEPTVELMASLDIDPANVVLWQATESAVVADFDPLDASHYRFGAEGLAAWPVIPSGSSLQPQPASPAPAPTTSVMPDLKAAQAELGITADGVWGPETAAAFGAFYEKN